MAQIMAADIDNWFTYHAPSDDQCQRYAALREKAKELALTIQELVPESDEKKAAMLRLRESVMLANAGIACNEE